MTAESNEKLCRNFFSQPGFGCCPGTLYRFFGDAKYFSCFILGEATKESVLHNLAGAFAALVDLGRPWLPATLKRFDTIIIDDKVQEAGMKDQMVPAEQVSGDLTDLVIDPGHFHTPADRRAAFIFRGYALGDFALAALAYDIARRGEAPQ